MVAPIFIIVRFARAAISPLKMAASTLRTSNTYLVAQFGRLRAKLDAPIAIKAMAPKLARLLYRTGDSTPQDPIRPIRTLA
jgi:hypothetical protein